MAFTIWFAAYLIWMWVAYNDGWNATAMIATSACFVAFPLILMVAKYFLFIPISTRRTFQKQKTLHQPCIYSWSEAGLTLANESGEWRVAWSDYLKWREDGRIFMFYQAPRLFNIYSAGNFIESSVDTNYFQLGESKYGKPIIDRVISRSSSLAQASKCALVSMDSTIRSNLSVGPPLDLAIIRRDEFRLHTHLSIESDNPYFEMIRTRWGSALREVFSELPDPKW